MIETHTTKFIEPDYIETPIGMVVIELLNVFIQFGIEFSKSVDIINMYPTRVAARYGPSFGSIQDSKDLLKINFYPKTPLNNDQFNKIKKYFHENTHQPSSPRKTSNGLSGIHHNYYFVDQSSRFIIQMYIQNFYRNIQLNKILI